MHPLEAFTAQMDEFVEQKKQEDRLPKTISEVWDCATSIEEHGFIGYEADNLHKELQKLKDAIVKLREVGYKYNPKS
tara:strand:- start:612 stop:842 length:231 start_codon:yes stop_codon:yes gene_type:complete